MKPSSTKLRVLVIEDNPADAFLVAQHLPGHDVQAVPTLAKGLALVREQTFDVALLDMHLPDATGPGMVTRLQERAPQLPIIVMTGSMGAEEGAREALTAGAQDWLAKDGMEASILRRSIAYAIDRKEFERKFTQSEERFRQLADNTQSIFWVFTADLSKVLYVNAAYDRITGANREALYADPMAWSYLVDPEDRPGFVEALRKLGRGEAGLDLRVRIRRPDTSIRWLHMRGFTVRDTEGHIYRIAGTCEDVTELHEAQLRLTDANRRLNSILEAAGEGIYGLDPTGAITFMNPAAAEALGYDAESLIGKGAHETFHHTKPDGRPHPREECPIYRVLKDGKHSRVEDDVFWRKDGRPIRVSYVASRKVDDSSSGLVVVFADTTARWQAEEAVAKAEARFRGMFENSSNRIILTDTKGIILATNRPKDQGGPDLVIGVPIFDVLPARSHSRELTIRRLAEACAGRASRGIVELPELGSVRDVSVTPLGEPGNVREILWETRDVTELHMARREAEEAKARLEELQRFRVQLFNNVAHDMATPLMVMQLRLEGIEEEPAAPDGSRVIDAKTLAAMRSATEQLSILTRDLRDVSLMEAGTFRLQMREVDLGHIARATVEDLSGIAARAGVALTATIPDRPHVVRGDAARLAQAMANLVTNAIKFSPTKGEVKLHLSASEGRVRLDVSDAGPGVPPEARSRLFRPFSQVHADQDVKKGTGLGLFIVRGIMRAHGGDADIVDTPARTGATFRLEIPEVRAP